MSKVSFKLEKREDEDTGAVVDTLFKVVDGVEEQWCTVAELDRLFGAAFNRWQKNWNLEKVIVAITESEID